MFISFLSKDKDHGIGLNTSWQIDGETMDTITDFIFLGSKITVDGDCSHEIKRGLLLGRKTMTNLDSILKSRDITLWKKFYLVKSRQCGRPGFDPWVGKILWRRKWQLTPVLLPGKPHGRSLVGYSPWGCKESDTTEQLYLLSQSYGFSGSHVWM